MPMASPGTHPELDVFVDHTSENRILASIPGRFTHLPRFSLSFPPAPRSQWKPVDRRGQFTWILDQDGIGECVGGGFCGGLMRARALANMPHVDLSMESIYAQINGGHDNGAVISDGLQALMSGKGAAPASLVQPKQIYLNQIPAAAWKEAARFKVTQAYHAQTFDEICWGIQLGFIAVYGIMVGSAFERFDVSGAFGPSRGPGNHCMHGDGLKLDGGVPLVDNVNSWTAGWGPFKNGRCFMRQEAIDGGGDMPDVCMIQVAQEDPNDPGPPTVAA